MKIKSIILPLFAVFVLAVSPVAVASDAKGGYTVYGAGIHSCAKVLEEHRKDTARYQFYIFWTGGFMSSAGAYNDTEKIFGKDGAGVDIDGIMHLVREYCDKNPLENLSNAADNVAEQLIDRAGRR